MLPRTSLNDISRLLLPERSLIQSAQNGLYVTCLNEQKTEVGVTLEPFKSRGNNCRRILARLDDDRQFVVEFGKFIETYGDDIDGIIRARQPITEGNFLRLDSPQYRKPTVAPVDSREVYENVRNSWFAGISYKKEHLDNQENVTGLRPPQLGALHAIASHWTLSKEPACIVLPTGTGKTEVMIATTISDFSKRVLVVVPTDALRQQTADKFKTYGILHQIGTIDNLLYPIVGTLASKPTLDHFAALRNCNIVVSTMSSIGLADENIQRDFAALFSHIFFDEAHHIEAATWKRFQKHSGMSKTLLFTATPFRENGKPIQGKIIYNFPLSAAQELGYFKPIRFIEVFEPDAESSDKRIADAAVDKLRSDLAAGYDHILIARTNSINAARDLYNHIYAPSYSDLNPVLIHSRLSRKQTVLNAIRNGEHKIIVCVNMFGEGFDLPNLKVAALHNVHKSLGITLQFIGRFARANPDVGEATFVANTADDGVPEALDSLYREDTNWNTLLADLSYDAIYPQARLSKFVNNLNEVQKSDEKIEISIFTLRPKISAQVYRTDVFYPQQFGQAFQSKQNIFQAHISQQDNLLVVIVNQQEKIDWTASKDIAIDNWDLYIAYFDSERGLLYMHSSRKGDSTRHLARAISQSPTLIKNEETFKVFTGLRRLILHSVGLSSHSRNVRYQMFAGLDVRDAIDPVQQQSKLKSNITGVGYEEGERRGIGCSRKGKIWSLRSGSIADWCAWCDTVGTKLVDTNNQPDNFLKHTLVPRSVTSLPTCLALMADWPDQLFESSNFRFEVISHEQSYGFDDCQIDLTKWNEGGDSFEFALQAGSALRADLRLRLETPPDSDETYVVEHVGGDNPELVAGGRIQYLTDYFNENPPLVRLEDGSQLAGNILLKPKEELHDTYEREQIKIIDWAGCDIKKESRWRGGVVRFDSVQQRMIEHLETSPATFIIDDDDTGESADIVAIEEEDERIIVQLWHCKYSSGTDVGNRAADLYEVCGQAQKSVKWTWNLRTLIKHLIIRETKHLRGRNTRFIRGTSSELATLRKAARRKFIDYKIGIVQPGLSKATIPVDHLAILGSTNTFIQCITNRPLMVIASE